MIRFTLKCSNEHRFESWFQSGDAFDKLHKAGMVACSECGDTSVQKAIMAPNVPAKNNAKHEKALSSPATSQEAALAQIKAHVEANSEYVGMNFAKEARSMHLGDTPERAIYGEAKPEEAKKLIEDGVPVAPLPFTPTRKAN